MQKRIGKLIKWTYLVCGGSVVFQAAGCNVDPDLTLRAALSFASDLSIFLLENLAVSF